MFVLSELCYLKSVVKEDIMCQMFVVTADKPIDISEKLKSFFHKSSIHKHGWGCADFSGDKIFIKRENIPAYKSGVAQAMADGHFEVKNAFFHLRYATVGAVEQENVHPFVKADDCGRAWSIVHNGTIFRSAAVDRFFHNQAGSTDTERLLLYIVECVNRSIAERKRGLDGQERFDLVEKILVSLALDGNKLNVAIYDGEFFYIHANSRSGSSALGEAGRRDFLYELDDNGAKFFATSPLDFNLWRPVELNSVSAYQNGRLVKKSAAAHPYEYFENYEDVMHLYQGFSQL
jgi:glutamine amidotransferase